MAEEFIGKITKLFGDGQRQNGWFAGVFRESSTGETFRVSGTYRNNLDLNLEYDISAEYEVNKYGEQYLIKTMSPHIELDDDSLIQYLSGDSFKGIGETIAKKIVKEFGRDTLDVIANRPDELREKLKLSDRQVGILIKGEASVSVENKLRKLVPFISKSLLEKIIDTYCDGESGCGGNEAIDIVKNEPYRLLYDLDGVKFKDIDTIALHLKFNKYDKFRIEECYRYAMTQHVNETKNLFITTRDSDDYNAFYVRVLDNIGYMDMYRNGPYNMYPQSDYDAVNSLFHDPNQIDGIRMIQESDGSFTIYDSQIYEEETGLSEMIAERLLATSVFMEKTGCTMQDIEDDIAIYERKNRIKFDDSQHTGILTSLMSPISIINGGPGHGKTSTVDCILFIWSRHMKDKKPVLSAPTGRAVTVLKNATHNEYDVATAMRRIVQMRRLDSLSHKRGVDADTFKQLDEMRKEYTDNIVVLDECSMVGMRTAFEFLSMFENCQFIFVGDVDQLPSIEYGQFFKDICDCNLIVKTCLTENHRAEGKLIVDNAEAINKGDASAVDYSDIDQFEMIPATGDFTDKIIETYKNWVYNVTMDDNGNEVCVLDEIKMKSICILCPTRYGPTGHLLLNKTIQDLVNPYDPTAKPNEKGYEIDATHMYINDTFKDVKLRVGDRVMQTKNRADAECHILVGKKRQDSMGIFNGDTGTILQFNHAPNNESMDSLVLLLDDGRQTIVYEENMKELILAYAISIHKSQGSEYEMVILSAQHTLAIDQKKLGSNEDFACRNLLYTAVTRAKKHVKIIGYEQGIIKCILTEKVPRKSMLMPRIMQEFKSIKEKRSVVDAKS